MSAALGLLRLQQVDTRIDQLEAELSRINAELANNEEEAEARRALQAAKSEQEDTEGARLAAEREASAQRSKLQQAESSLYGGRVRNPKELQDLQADVASLKKHLLALDQAELGWMEKLERVDDQYRATNTSVERILARRGETQAHLREQQAELLRAKASLEVERSVAVDPINRSWLDVYEGLRRSRRGVAVASIADGACGVCGTGLTAVLQQNARHSPEIIHCPSCGRILFAD